MRIRKPLSAKRRVAAAPPAVAPPAPIAPTPALKVPETASVAIPSEATPASSPKLRTRKQSETEAVPTAPLASSAVITPATVPASAPVETRPLPTEPPLRIPPILLEGDEPTQPPPVGPGEKFALGPTPRLFPTESMEMELPAAYGTGRLFLTARDPHCLYAYWDLTAEQQRICNSLSKHHHLVVRVYEETVGSRPINELHVHPESRHWFIHVEHAGRSYIAELGYYQPDGPFRTAAVSEPVATPLDAVAEDQPAKFTSITFETVRPPAAPGGPAPASPESSERGLVSPPSANPQPEWPTPFHSGAQNSNFGDGSREAGIQFPEPTPPPAWDAEFQSRELGHAPYHTEPETTFPVPPATSIPEWTPAQELALAEIIGWTLVQQQWPGSAEIAALLRGPAQPSISSVEMTRPAVPLAAGPAISSPAGGLAPEISSPPGAEFQVPTSFWFNVNAELVIYGATEPGAQVTIGGRPIRLRQDGTFSYRFALPDGYYRLPLTALAVDGDARHAELEFFRGTHYRGEVGAHPQDPALKAPHVENLA